MLAAALLNVGSGEKDAEQGVEEFVVFSVACSCNLDFPGSISASDFPEVNQHCVIRSCDLTMIFVALSFKPNA